MRESAYRQFVADLVADAARPKADLREEIIFYVHHESAAGKPWAAEVLNRWERAGADADWTS